MQKEDPEFDTPILFLIFNRPELTEKVFGQIRKIRPKQLFIGADGPRKDKHGEDEKCQATRQLVLDMIDWECEVKTLFREENLGCGLAVSQAITWFFEHVEMGIILEDDCYPDLSFFWFCSELLEYYKDDERVMHICGSNFIKKDFVKHSYYYSNYPNVWGWAAWRSKWSKFTYNMDGVNSFLASDAFVNTYITVNERTFWKKQFIKTVSNEIDTWAYRWRFSIHVNKGMAVVPGSNLVKNMGFGNDATHTSNTNHPYNRIKLRAITFPLVHPTTKQINYSADSISFKLLFNSNTTFQNSVRNILYLIIPPDAYNICKSFYYKFLSYDGRT